MAGTGRTVDEVHVGSTHPAGAYLDYDGGGVGRCHLVEANVSRAVEAECAHPAIVAGGPERGRTRRSGRNPVSPSQVGTGVSDESGCGIGGGGRAVQVRRMSAVGQHQVLDSPPDLAGNRFELGRCPILIVLSLNKQYRACDVGEHRLDIPRLEVRVQPHVVPGVEGRCRFVVVPRHPLNEVGVFEPRPGVADLAQAARFGKDVGSQQHHGVHLVLRRMEQRDRGTV